MSEIVSFAQLLARVSDGEILNVEDSTLAVGAIMAGDVTPPDMAAFLTALAKRSPSVDEITGGARAMRAAMRTITAPDDAIDLCGTGGDGHGTVNISTACAFVVAACGVPVAKHGNRSASSRTGTADVLETLGVKIDQTPEGAQACLKESGLCFLFAPAYHTAMKHVAPVRKELGFRTLFNLLGPVCNPAHVRRQLLGVYAKEWVEPIAHVLAGLGAERAWVVHGSDGLDELTTTGITHAAILENGAITLRDIAPEDAGLRRAQLNELKGGERDENAAALIRVLNGEHGAFRDIVLLNAAAALNIAGKANNLRDGAALAANAIDSGAAKATLEKLVRASQSVTA
ncbi:MAG TPA: anthranilate phosphoribosyltransferase [Rhizomicrobium sp.]|nr:anthranilate phosphoribosyltransferase [Rhizomicrobium sp.]